MAMKRSNVFSLFLQMMPSHHHAVAPSLPDHWAFLEEVDAPQWVDLAKEAALMGTLGDDPWFHRCHIHHETSLARATNLVMVTDANGSPIEMPTAEQQEHHLLQPTTRKGAAGKGTGKGTVSKLIKPALKAKVVKACLGGGMQRISNGGSNGVGRLSSRPRLSTGLLKSKPLKKVTIIPRPVGGLLQQQQQKKAGYDPRAAQNEPFSDVGTPKKSSEGKMGRVGPSDPVLNVRETATHKTVRRGGVPGRSNAANGENDDMFSKEYESSSSILLNRLPSPLYQAGAGNLSQADFLRGHKADPIDMNVSSDASPAHSISSQESLARAMSTTAAEVSRRKILAEGMLVRGRRSNSHSGEAVELPSDSPQSSEIIDVGVNEPHLEVSSFKGDDGVDNSSASSGLDWNHEDVSRSVKRSLGPPLRVKQTYKEGSSSLKKKKSMYHGLQANSINEDGAGAPTEKSTKLQATHPILEKLRKSWGSALRVKQRQEAELSDSRTGTSAEHSIELKGGNGSVVAARKKWDQAQPQSEVLRRAQQSGAATSPAQASSDREVLIRNIISRERRAAIITQHTQQHKQLQFITDPDSPGRSGLRSNDSDNRSKTSEPTRESKTTSAAAANAAKAGLAKIQANYQRSNSEVLSKFKKQYTHGETGSIITKSLSMQRGNKENMHLERYLEVKVKGQTSPQAGLKRKPAVPRRQLSPRHPGMAVNEVRNVPQAATARISAQAARASVNAQTQLSPQRKNPSMSKNGPLVTWAKSVGHEASDASVPYSEPLDKKANNSGTARGSTSSLLKLTKQKSEKISSTTAKEAVGNAAGGKQNKSALHISTESLTQPITGEERKSRTVVAKYEPRLHSAKAIKEWESKSGKRYYDLPRGERERVNHEIAAASKTTVTTKRTTA